LITEHLTSRALNRALLARQGLLEKWEIPLVEVVESIGALLAQYWPALPVALWSRPRSTNEVFDFIENWLASHPARPPAASFRFGPVLLRNAGFPRGRVLPKINHAKHDDPVSLDAIEGPIWKPVHDGASDVPVN
jgi:hypothetical protein